MKKFLFLIFTILFATSTFTCVYATAGSGDFEYFSADGTHGAVLLVNTEVYTPNGYEVIVYANAEIPVTDAELKGWKDKESQYGATIISGPSTTYNCHFYAWANEYYESGDRYCMEANQVINKYLADGSYVVTTTVSEACIVGYYDSNSTLIHSARIESTNGDIIVTSKWGAGPLFEHILDQCDDAENTASYVFYKRGPSHLHIYNIFNSINATQHEKKCSCGNVQATVPHNFTYTYTDTTHTASCSQNCGYVGTAEGHTFVVKECDDSNHVLSCSTCGYNVAEAHDLDYTNESTHHSIECTVCGYTSENVAHAILYAKVNVNYHNKYCGNCTYSVAEAHTWTQSGALYSCGYCGQVSSFIPVVPASLSAEALSQLMAVPAAEGEIAVAFVDGVQYAILDGQIYLVVECE